MACSLLDERPRTKAELRALLGNRWPDADRESLAHAVTYLMPLVQVTPRGMWGTSGVPTWARLETWLGRELAAPHDPAPDLDRMIIRYLGTFGPASVVDAQEWCGLTRLTEVFERLRPWLISFRAESGRELFDLPDAPRPDPDAPAPVRFLPQYDNLLLGHADRSRVIPDAVRARSSPTSGAGSFLVDGMVAGTWRIADAGSTSTILAAPHGELPGTSRDEVQSEAAALVTFLRPGAGTREVRFVDSIG